ncbi:TonB-dependent receptor [Pararhizobium qamdonense]|uniref:TonB-dependent receptor n=1 Tax=Pararhizobium qamdonense TaxID=3031126 RepID=UPI0023E0C27C|nr:TonB-dependent receptor [Pararhizobium qamdonense]
MRSQTGRNGNRFLTARHSRAHGLRLLATSAVIALTPLDPASLSPASAQDKTSRLNGTQSFNIPSQPLPGALNAFGRQSGLQVTLAAATSRGVRSNAVSGTLEPQQALAQLLSGTGISYQITGGTAVIGQAASSGDGTAAARAAGATALEPISVFGESGTLGAGEIQISAKDLERTNPASIADVFSGEPGISVGSSLPMSQKVYVHGIEENNLAVTVDGSRQNNKVFHHAGTNLIDPMLLKAVSVDAGVAPADAGPGALGGAIAYETKDARDLLDGDGFGGFVTSSYNFNSDTVTTGIAAYGLHEGLEFLGAFNFGKGHGFTAGNGENVEGTSTDILSGLGKLGYEFDSGDRIEISHERIHDEAPRPYRANAGFVDPGRPWKEPTIRDYILDRQNTVLTYTDSTPEGWWDPKLVLAYSRTELETTVFLDPRFDIAPYAAIGTTESLNGKFENKFSLDIGTIVAGVDFYSDKADLEDAFDPGTEKSRNIGLYAQARIEPWDRMRLSFGGRGDSQKFTGTTGEDWNNSGLSGNVSGEYDLIADVLIAKAGYSHVWAGPTLAENFVVNPRWDYSSGPKPVTADNYNIGLEANYNDFTVEGSVFQTRLDDARAPRFAIARAIETHDVRSTGFEIGGGYSWGDGFFKVKYADIDVEIDGKPADSDIGTYLAAPAGQIITVQAVHTFTDWGITLGADAEIALDYDHVAPGSKPYQSYQVFNAFLEYKPPTRPNLTFRADIKNIFDETYSDRATYGQEFANVVPLYEQGRAFILTARATF